MRKLLVTLLSLLTGLMVGRAEVSADRWLFVLNGAEIAFSEDASQAQRLLDTLQSDPRLRLELIRIRSGASPEGAVADNQAASDRRAARMQQTLQDWLPGAGAGLFEIESVGEDYATLRELLALSGLDGAQEAIHIIDNVPCWVFDANGRIVSSRKKQLMDLRGGRLWSRMREELFPALRGCRVEFVYSGQADDASGLSDQRPPETVREGSHLLSRTQPLAVYFPVGKSAIYPGYLGNERTINQIDSVLLGFRTQPDRRLTAIHLSSGASPEGPVALNGSLSLRRADTLRSHLAGTDPALGADLFRIQSLGEDYGGLADYLGGISQPWVRQALELIGDPSIPDAEAALRRLSGGSVWRTLHRDAFPWLRRATVSFEYETALLPSPPLLTAPATESASAGLLPRLPFRTELTAAEPALRPVLALSTNLLYDITYVPGYGLTSIPSLSLEYYPARSRHFSFGADVEWPMWQHWDTHRFLQIQNITLWTRRYFRDCQDRFRGLYLLGSANGARFGIGFDDTRGWEGEGLGASLGIGHKWILGKSRFWLDLGLAAGVFWARYDPYVYGHDATRRYYYDYAGDPAQFTPRNHRLFWAGPTRVWLSLGIDLFNRRRR